MGVASTPCLLCHDTMHCIVTKAGKWVVAHLAARKIIFFSHNLFFSFFQLLEDHKKNILYFFHFSVEPNKFIKIYFILFFPVLHIVKPKKKILNTFFFLCAIHQALNSHNHTSYTTFIKMHTIHQNAQCMHDLTRFPSSPRYSYT